jgi:hypothetical protein
MTQGKIIGAELSKAGAPTTAGLAAGAVVEGGIIGLAEKATNMVKDAGAAVKSFFSKEN